MRISLIELTMKEVEEQEHVMVGGGILHATIVGKFKMGIKKRHEPILEEAFIAFRKERSGRNQPYVSFRFHRILLWNGSLVFFKLLPWVISKTCNSIHNYCCRSNMLNQIFFDKFFWNISINSSFWFLWFDGFIMNFELFNFWHFLILL